MELLDQFKCRVSWSGLLATFSRVFLNSREFFEPQKIEGSLTRSGAKMGKLENCCVQVEFQASCCRT